MTDSLLAHLLDIASDPASGDLILGGGYGIRMKQRYLRQSESKTLIPAIPDARATQDLDFFLPMAFFIQKQRAQAIRALLDRLDYQEYTPRWQFGKSIDVNTPEIKMKIDLLARTPRQLEDVPVKRPRVGAGTGMNIHGRETPEAFAVEDMPLRIPLTGTCSDGRQVEATILVPHPYASLNMKVMAAHDWLQMRHGAQPVKPNSERHVFDVYMLIAMFTEAELAESESLAEKYRTLPIAEDIRANAKQLFGAASSPGITELRRITASELDYSLFWAALTTALGA